MADPKAEPARVIGVLGAGTMGAGIAQLLQRGGIVQSLAGFLRLL